MQGSIIASFHRASVYGNDVSEEDKNKLHKALRSHLAEFAQQHIAPVSEDIHVKNINSLADIISAECNVLLLNGGFRIGIAQKVLNLYLKYLWCLEQIPPPPHCPFDSLIIAKLPQSSRVSWTQLDDIPRYLAFVVAAKRPAGTKLLAEWEHEQYQSA